MKLFTARITENEEIMPATHVLSLHAPQAARSAAPGQFLHIQCGVGNWPLLRRPMSIFRAQGETIQLMVRNVGEGSAWLTRRRVGDDLDCLGPLGHAFRLDSRSSNLLMVGGGYGVAPLVGLADRAVARNLSITLLVGAGTAALVFPSDLIVPEVEYVVATDDGSAGHRGLVTDLVEERLPWADAVFACGPLPMMRALTGILKKRAPRLPARFAMEERMGCAMGVCLGCAIETVKGPMRVCTEGPVFDPHQIIWRDD